MKLKTIQFSLALLCLLTLFGSLVGYIWLLETDAEYQSRQRADSYVEKVNAELDAYLRAQSRQLSLQASLTEVTGFYSSPGEDPTPVLNRICDINSASLCYLMDLDGYMVAVNDNPLKQQILGNNFAYRPYFSQALSGISSVYLALGYRTKKRGLYFSHQVRGEQGQLLGVIVNKIDITGLEERFTDVPGKMVLLSPDSIVMASNIREWVFKSMNPLDSWQQQLLVDGRQFGERVTETLPFVWKNGSPDVTDEFGNNYRVSTAEIERLPGWRWLYLEDENYLPSSHFSDLSVLTLLTLMAVILTMITWMLLSKGRTYIHELSREIHDLRISESRLRQLTQTGSEAVLLLRGNQIIDFNEIAEGMFGYTRNELLSTEMPDLWGSTQTERVAKAMANSEQHIEAEAVRHDGMSFPVELNTKHIILDDGPATIINLQDITVRRQREKLVRYQAQFDALTNLPNRTLMTQRLERAISRSALNDGFVVLMFIDLDDFKKINDSLGHKVGDELLISVSQRLQDVIHEDDTLARYGGDEFILILENQQSQADAEAIARKILVALAMEFQLQGRSYFISGSIGLVIAPQDGTQPEELLKKADTAMYHVKAEGRNNFAFYTPEMNNEITDRLEVEDQLRGALERDEIYLNFQPIYSFKEQQLLGAEVLVRWDNIQLGMVPPDVFIPVAEQTGLIVPLGEWILTQACHQAKQWSEQLNGEFTLGINVSPRQFKDGHIVQVLHQALENSGFPAHQLVLEITEGLLIKHDASTKTVLQQIKDMGICLSMDDFGTGYSSLSYLKQFPFDVVKIDRSFVRDLASDPSDQKLILASIAMAKGLGLKVVAEGVEDVYQYDFLHTAGCDAVQGYLLGRPMSAEVFYAQVMDSSVPSEDLVEDGVSVPQPGLTD
ncbi:bifunctional diguanylate cyclase/phosphodiesterase [Aliamphritea hakodatensis]|uniref:bifunctional diguanylate cyclase/phosphodiesterase n=1 Tax=Aliamphritea hakodatensis TaxID=2895352 RepID=UPI0022FD5D96|nr:EAL domain-containing protein [Aliamphritea hakodatensis]